MTIYRVENAMGEGPYRNNLGFNMLNHDGMSNRRPGPTRDDFFFPEIGESDYSLNEYRNALYNYMSWEIKFAFSCKNQLRNWFTKKERTIMKNHGFAVVTYKIKKRHTRISSHQVMFNRDDAKFKNTIDFGPKGEI